MMIKSDEENQDARDRLIIILEIFYMLQSLPWVSLPQPNCEAWNLQINCFAFLVIESLLWRKLSEQFTAETMAVDCDSTFQDDKWLLLFQANFISFHPFVTLTKAMNSCAIIRDNNKIPF